MSNIHLTKLAAARRQLCAAIRMYFAGEDELAVHTVASAAYRIIADLKSKRGRDEAADYWLMLCFYFVRDHRRGTLPDFVTEDQEQMARIRELAEQLPMITATSRFEDINASATPDFAKWFWDKRNKVANFLKHADRDASAHISMDEVDNLLLLLQAQASYFDLDKNGLGNEGLVLLTFSHANSKEMLGDTELPEYLLGFEGVAAYLEPLSHEERLRFCSNWLQEWNQREEAGE